MTQKRPAGFLSRSELAASRTHCAAKTIIDADTAAREAKVQRLRMARLERDASDAAQAVVPVGKARTAKNQCEKADRLTLGLTTRARSQD